MAYTYKLPSGKWRCQVDTMGVRESESFDREVDARAWGKAREEDIRSEARRTGRVGSRKSAGADSESAQPSEPTVRKLFEVYEDVEVGDTDSSKFNRLRMRKWCSDPLADLKISQVTTHDINLWAKRRAEPDSRGKKVSPPTIRRELNLMSGAFSYAVSALKWIKTNPCRGANKPPDSRPRKRPLMTPEEIRAILISSGYNLHEAPQTATAKVGATFLLALETGARSGELLRVMPEHYDRDKRTLLIAAIEKGGRKGSRSGQIDSSRVVPLSSEAIRLLDQLLTVMPPDQPYIVGLTDDQRDALWRKCRDRAGVEDLHFHDLKHEACTRLSRFLDVFELSHAVGTKDIRLLRDTYYVNNAEAAAKRLPDRLAENRPPTL